MSQISRVVRIFISSTFRDFGGERDELVKRVFPELRRRCKARFIELLEVDLRWGVTEEQNRRGDTLRICLQEIDRCRPSSPVFFIGLLGDRYGWIPEKDYYPKDVLEDPSLRWVQEHVGGKSVTELEILHGVLNNAAMAQKAFFYFRKEGYHHRHWQEIQSTHPFLKPEDFSNAAAADTERQTLLKQRINAASLKHRPQEYETPADMAKSVLGDLWKEIDRAFPADESPDELARQRMEHEAFAQSRSHGYVPRAGLFECLDKVLKSKSPSCTVVSGQSGGGKSALLAAWMKWAKLPKRTFVHYIGGTPESSTVRSIVLRLMETIRRWGAVRAPIPNDFGEAVQLLPQWLEKAAKGQKGGFVLVLDALNQLEDERDRNLWWLPKTLPKGVRLVVSTLPGESEEEIKKRGWLKENNRIEVSPLTGAERREIIASYLGRFTKQLEDRLVDRLALAPQTGNALFLKVVLDELRLRGRHENLDALVNRMLEAKDPIELFVQVLKCLEEHDRNRPHLVREAMGYLAVARRGLTESELLQLLSAHSEPANNPLPMAVWSPLYLALEESLVNRFGRLGFFHDYLRQAVEREYLDEDWERKKVHGRLGEVAMSWNTERFSPSLRGYGLAYGAHHLRQEDDHEKLWALLNNEGYRIAQKQEFKRVDETVEGLRHGVETYAARDGQTDEDDVRLCWLMLRCGEVVQDARTNLQPVFEEFRISQMDDPNRVKNALSHFQILTEPRFYQACSFLLYLECKRSMQQKKVMSPIVADVVVNQLKEKLKEPIAVKRVEWLENSLAQQLPWHLFLWLVSKTTECDERLRYAAEVLALANRWNHALEYVDAIKDTKIKTTAFTSLAELATEAQNVCLAKELLHRALDLSAEICDPSDVCKIKGIIAISMIKVKNATLANKLLQETADVAKNTCDPAILALTAETFSKANENTIATELFTLSLDAAYKLEGGFERSCALGGVATALARAGRKEHAQIIISGSLEAAAEIDFPSFRAIALGDILPALCETGDWKAALNLLSKEEYFHDHVTRSNDLSRLVCLTKFSDPKRALQVVDMIENGDNRSNALLAISDMLAKAGHVERAQELLMQAMEIPEEDKIRRKSIYEMVAPALTRAEYCDQAIKAWGAMEDSWDKVTLLGIIAERVMQSGSGDLFVKLLGLAGEIHKQYLRALAYGSIGGALENAGKHGKALEVFTQALEEARQIESIPHRCDVLITIAKTLTDTGQLQQAREVIALAQKAANTLKDAHVKSTYEISLAKALAKGRDFWQAMELAGQIPEGDEKWETLVSITEAMVQAGEFAEALNIATKIVPFSERAKVYVFAAEALLSDGKKEAAAKVLSQALEAVAPVVELICCFDWAEKHNFTAALEAAGRIKDDWLQGYALTFVSGSLARLGQIDESEEVLAKAEALRAMGGADINYRNHYYDGYHRPHSLISMAKALLRLGQNREALMTIAYAVKKASYLPPPDQSNTFLSIAEVLVMAGQKKSAHEVLLQAIEVAVEIENTEDQCRSLASIVGRLASLEDPNKGLAVRLNTILKTEASYSFLCNLELDEHSQQSSIISWLRLFATMCPSLLAIDQAIVSSLIAAHIRRGNIGIACKIAKRCPQLGLAEILN